METVKQTEAVIDDDLTIDSATFESMQKNLVDQKRAEIADIQHAIGNIEFSKSRLDIQHAEKRRILENRLAELARIEGLTLGQLLENKA